MAQTSTHFVSDKVKALCFLKDVRANEHERVELLPLLAVGGWDADVNTLALYLPVVSTSDEEQLRAEFAPQTVRSSTNGCDLKAVAQVAHEGDVNALGFVSTGSANRLFSASSTGSVFAYSVGEGSGDQVLAPIAVPQWKSLTRGAVTSLDVSPHHSTIAVAAESGEVAWLRLDESDHSAQVIRNNDSSRLALHQIKMLGRESLVATVGATPGSQLRLWDINANQSFPVLSAADPQTTSALTSIEVHPTRPELLVTGSDDGRVALWDQRRLDAPFRVEVKHQRAVHALKVHETSPRYLFSAGADASVLSWDFHHGRSPSDTVEYERHLQAHGATGLHVKSVSSGFLPWNVMAFHADSDTLVAGSDAQSLLLVRGASRAQSQWTQ
ncbi:hypothetical protein Poli38472_003421 [Pythium oligandrum]|uniref:Guanine nucleotide-binding protein subunit beta-like protein n=1 Tax=Pythium oligandrum TaxID=41045 RepID=A0A8K1FCR7_PYTOL|nr:hypothetical protein Poli38472_003421 [Pythium oligandrum]|eukprot:TMW57496.1 hypothetical protein Poli38472_003421 [Pythium oligandrum]